MKQQFTKPFILVFALLLHNYTFHLSAQLPTKYADSIEGIEADGIGVYIEDLESGDVVLDINGEKAFTPASVTKLLTIATLVETVDLNSRYTTDTWLKGTIVDTIFNGDIVVECVGDPTIESSYFKAFGGFTDSIASNICKLGIKEINGNIIINSPDWIEVDVPSGWKDGDVAWPYGAGHYGVNFSDNRIALTVSRGGKWSTKPEVPGLSVETTTRKHPDAVWRAKRDKCYHVVYAGKNPVSHTVANPDPAATMRISLEKSLAKLGIKYTFCDSIYSEPQAQSMIYSHQSPTIKEIAKSTLQRSDNLMAEAMLRYAHKGKSRQDAVNEELQFWGKTGWDTEGMSIEDGSGLSRQNKISPYALADLLSWMYLNSDHFQDFIDMFPVAATSGTLRNFMKGSSLAGQFKAKTGSLNGVQCYAGYVMNSYGFPSHIVVVMINGMKIDRAAIKKNLELLLENYCTFVVR